MIKGGLDVSSEIQNNYYLGVEEKLKQVRPWMNFWKNDLQKNFNIKKILWTDESRR